ncbi:hypothetical protein Rifp1Sym_ar00340 [endosymbiont of Riftia pachyptila (vent Ph05)]|uniref:Uncharacterized protein n=1 Tax=endosymbiont of Riftia pachyptila (vent Ph05) TaxID=1048808 RepID=G2DBI3_9GAMM|nr:hypothetical protein Rifp1Sym_ar00340 [endosymbiont of Riftia pachyptila (vent Ph05)]
MGSPTLKKHLCSLLILLFSASWVEAAIIDHQIEIQLDPASGSLQVRDQITLPAGSPPNSSCMGRCRWRF